MRLGRSVGLPLLLVALGSGGATSRGADSAAEATLKGKGLAKAVNTYVIEAEKPVLAQMKDLRAAVVDYAAIADRRAQAGQAASRAAELEEGRAGLKERLAELNQQIIEQGAAQPGPFSRPGPGNVPQGGFPSPLVAERDRIKAMLAEVNQGQKALKAEAAPARDATALDEEVRSRAESLRKALAELRPRVDAVTKTYADLGADPAVKKALGDLMAASKARLKLGPSDAFVAGARQLDQAERRLLGKPKSATSKKKKSRSRR